MSDLPAAYLALHRPERRSPMRRLAEVLSRRAEDEAIRRSREKLAEYDDRLLRDIGLTREEALRCASRSAWNAPDWWLGMRAR
jgi:uncharacterized protein YjiS (DUF1127 family)